MRKLLSSTFLNNSLLLTIDSIVAALFTGIYWLVAARLVTPSQVGIASTIISATSLIALLSRLGFDFVIPHYYPKGQSVTSLIRTAFSVTSVVASTLSLIAFFILPLWLPELQPVIAGWYGLVLIVCLTLSLLLINLFLSTAIAANLIPWVIAQDVIQNGGRLLIWGLIAFLFKQDNALIIVGAFAVSAVLSVLLGFARIFPRSEIRGTKWFNRDVFLDVREYALKSYGTSLLATTPGFILPLLTTWRLSTSATAVFSICWMIFSAMMVFHSSFATVAFAEGSRDLGSLRKKLPSALAFSWGIILMMALVVALAGRPILSLFGHQYASQGYTLLLLLTGSLFFLASNDFCNITHRAHKEMNTVYLIIGSSSIGSIVLSYFFVQRAGVNGVGYAYLAVQLVVFLLTLSFDMKHPLRLKNI